MNRSEKVAQSQLSLHLGYLQLSRVMIALGLMGWLASGCSNGGSQTASSGGAGAPDAGWQTACQVNVGLLCRNEEGLRANHSKNLWRTGRPKQVKM